MANLGLLGPANALIPFNPVEQGISSTVAVDYERILLEELRLGTVQSKLREESDASFERICDENGVLTEEMFITCAHQIWGFDRRKARACFHACDRDRSRRMDKLEYLMFRAAFIYFDQVPQHKELISLRLKAVFHLYVFARPAQRAVDHDAMLTPDELRCWIRDLCSGDSHVDQVADSILPALWNGDGGDETHGVTEDQFVQALMFGKLEERLRAQGLSLDDLWGQSNSNRSRSRIVFDGRCETVYPFERAQTQSFSSIPESRSKGDVDKFKAASNSKVFFDSDIVPAEAVNQLMELDPLMRAVGGWRGPLAPNRDTEEFALATEVINVAMQWAHDFVTQPQCLDSEWMPEGAALRALLGDGEEEQAAKIVKLACSCRRQLAAQPTVVRTSAPAKIFGDVHGQFRDLLLLFGHFGRPTHLGGDIQTMHYVFNGDWVDRGDHQLEVVCLLFALKTLYPAHIFLVRGNHEFKDMSMWMEEDGFYYHCRWQLPNSYRQVFDAVHGTFEWLPLAAIIADRALVLHGGIGDGTWGVKDLEAVERPLQKETIGCVLNALWSDPSDSDSTMAKGVYHNPERGQYIHQFGPDVTNSFCKREGINLIVRSHQYVRQGYKVMHGGHLVTLFSARNYLGVEDDEVPNDGALLLLATDCNGHLRIHPKRLARVDPTPPRRSSFLDLLSRCLPCCAE